MASSRSALPAMDVASSRSPSRTPSGSTSCGRNRRLDIARARSLLLGFLSDATGVIFGRMPPMPDTGFTLVQLRYFAPPPSSAA